jgi:two-component system chemotaxis sensor kinase CheA
MAAFADTDLLAEFLAEARELLVGVDVQLVELERRPGDAELLNKVFRGFHTIKGGAGFLEAPALVELCHRTENLFDRLRNGAAALTPPMMDTILAATAEVRRMFGEMAGGVQPAPAPPELIARLEPEPGAPGASRGLPASKAPDWQALYDALLGRARAAAPGPAAAGAPAAPAKPVPAPGKETTLRVDTARFDQILNLSGELGLTRNRLNCLRGAFAAQGDAEELRKQLDVALGELDTLVCDLQTAVMKARMQPVGRVFQKYIRLARDLARGLGKDVELVLEGEDTEIDKSMLEELNDPLVHLVRNAIDHGVDSPAERAAAGKPARAAVRLSARQEGDQIVIEVADDGRGIEPGVIRAKAVEKGLLGAEEAGALDERQSLNLILLPGFSTKSEVTDVSGRGVGMDVVATSIRRLKGRVDIVSRPGRGTRFVITLPLTLAILPVLNLKLGGQPLALPLSCVHEIIALEASRIQRVGGRPALLLRGEVLPIVDLAALLGRERGRAPEVGVIAQSGEARLVLAVDATLGQDEVMVKPLGDFKPRGVAGATLSGGGELVLVLELSELLSEAP